MMTEKCGICGFVGERDQFIPHDCYLHLRKRIVPAAPPERVSEGKGLGDYQELVDDLYRLFTSTSKEIAQFFGESRCTDDSARLNYALELMESYVTERPDAAARPAVEPREEPR